MYEINYFQIKYFDEIQRYQYIIGYINLKKNSFG